MSQLHTACIMSNTRAPHLPKTDSQQPSTLWRNSSGRMHRVEPHHTETQEHTDHCTARMGYHRRPRASCTHHLHQSCYDRRARPRGQSVAAVRPQPQIHRRLQPSRSRFQVVPKHHPHTSGRHWQLYATREWCCSHPRQSDRQSPTNEPPAPHSTPRTRKSDSVD